MNDRADTIEGLVPGERFELPTNGLQNRYSTRYRSILRSRALGFRSSKSRTPASAMHSHHRRCGWSKARPRFAS